jgi:hypothetical protein
MCKTLSQNVLVCTRARVFALACLCVGDSMRVSLCVHVCVILCVCLFVCV